MRFFCFFWRYRLLAANNNIFFQLFQYIQVPLGLLLWQRMTTHTARKAQPTLASFTLSLLLSSLLCMLCAGLAISRHPLYQLCTHWPSWLPLPPFPPLTTACPAQQAPWDNVSPNLGLHWYLFAESFPRFRPFFAYCVAALPAVVTLPLAIRFPHRPLFLLAIQAITNGLLAPHPTYSDVMLWVVLLSMLGQEVAELAYGSVLALGFVATLAANTATYEVRV